MRSILLRVAIAGVAALTAACNTADSISPRITAGSPQRTVSADAASDATISRQVDQAVWVSCANSGAGEAVRVTGRLRYDVHRTQDATGVIHLDITSNTSGLTGVGQTSGTFFRGMMAERTNSRAVDYLNEDVRTTDVIRFVEPGTGAAYALIATNHFIVDEGTYVLWEQTWNEVCR